MTVTSTLVVRLAGTLTFIQNKSEARRAWRARGARAAAVPARRCLPEKVPTLALIPRTSGEDGTASKYFVEEREGVVRRERRAEERGGVVRRERRGERRELTELAARLLRLPVRRTGFLLDGGPYVEASAPQAPAPASRSDRACAPERGQPPPRVSSAGIPAVERRSGVRAS